MRGNELLDKMALIDPAYVEAADEKPKPRKRAWIKWCAMAACLCLVIGRFAVHQFGVIKAPADTVGADDYPQDSIAYGFYLDGNSTALYLPISFEDRIRYELVPNGEIGLTGSYIYQITEDDLGNLMGTVTDCKDETIIGSQVYHFARYPEYDSICIADTPNGYAFYVCGWLDVPVEIGDISDAVLAVYGLPNSLGTMEIFTLDSQCFSIDDEATIKAVLEIVSGKVNIGTEANERLFAQAWYDAYGNDDIHYSEESGACVARYISLFGKAHELWNEGERIIQITTDRGFGLTIYYFPVVRVFACGYGYYELSTNDVESLNALLQI